MFIHSEVTFCFRSPWDPLWTCSGKMPSVLSRVAPKLFSVCDITVEILNIC